MAFVDDYFAPFRWAPQSTEPFSPPAQSTTSTLALVTNSAINYGIKQPVVGAADSPEIPSAQNWL
eukprot:1029229-Pelagomonas_calceolata.AAC.4